MAAGDHSSAHQSPPIIVRLPPAVRPTTNTPRFDQGRRLARFAVAAPVPISRCRYHPYTRVPLFYPVSPTENVIFLYSVHIARSQTGRYSSVAPLGYIWRTTANPT